MRNPRTVVLGAGIVALALFASACGSGGDDETASPAEGTTTSTAGVELTIGVSGAFAENQLVAEMYSQVLENAGYTVNRELDIGTRELSDQALESGEIDLKPEYTGFELGFWDPEATTNGAPEDVAAALQDAAAERGLTTYAISPANSTNVFVTLPATAEEYGLSDLSSVAPVAGELTLGAPAECPDQPFCLPGLRDVYGIEFGEVRPLDQGGRKTVAAIDAGVVDVAELFSLDPTITEKGYTVLTDDQNLQANGNFVPLVREEVATEELGEFLDSVTTVLTDEYMRELVGQVVNEQRDVADVASDFLSAEGLL